MLPTTNITTTLVGNTLGISSRDIGTLCTSDKINIWSEYKPVKTDTIYINPAIRNQHTGFSYKDIQHGIYSIRMFTYEKPNKYFRLGDFREYNHNAKIFNAKIPDASFVGAPPQTNVFIGQGETSAVFTVKVAMPEIYPYYFNADLPNRGNIDIVYFYDNDVKVLGTFNLSGVTYELYKTNYANKEISINCTNLFGLPGPGMMANHTYYIRMSGAMFVSMSFCAILAYLYKQFVQDPTDPEQWYSANVTLDPGTSGVSNIEDYIKYTSFEYLMRKDEGDKIYFRFRNLWHGFPGISAGIIASYKNVETNQWVDFIKIGNPINEISSYTLLNNAQYFSGDVYTSQHLYIIGGTEQTVSCANATVMIPPAVYDTKIKIRYVNR